MKSTEYATSEVTQGRKIAVRNRPRHFRFGIFRHDAMHQRQHDHDGYLDGQEDELVLPERPHERSGRSRAGLDVGPAPRTTTMDPLARECA